MSDPLPAATADRAERFVLAIDLGTGGPKVGLVSLTGRVAWSDHSPVETHLLPGGGAETPGSVANKGRTRLSAKSCSSPCVRVALLKTS